MPDPIITNPVTPGAAGNEPTPNQPGQGNPPADPKPGDPTPPATPEPITKTAEEWEKEKQREADRRVTEALKKKEEEAKLALEKARKEAMAEGERLAKMSQEERLKAEKERDELKLQQDREALEKERADFNRQKLLLETEKILVERKLPPTFAEVLVGADADTTLERINTFEQRWLEAVDVEVTERLKGKTPTGFAGKNLSQLEQLQREHDEAVKNNRPLEERLSLKNQIYELQTQKG